MFRCRQQEQGSEGCHLLLMKPRPWDEGYMTEWFLHCCIIFWPFSTAAYLNSWLNCMSRQVFCFHIERTLKFKSKDSLQSKLVEISSLPYFHSDWPFYWGWKQQSTATVEINWNERDKSVVTVSLLIGCCHSVSSRKLQAMCSLLWYWMNVNKKSTVPSELKPIDSMWIGMFLW